MSPDGVLVLDAQALSALAAAPVDPRARGFLHAAFQRERDVIVPAVVCAEVCRGVARTRAVEALLARQGRSPRDGRAITVVPTDLAMAKQVGAILHAAGTGTEDLVDAHVVAACVPHGTALVLTADEDDIHRLAATVPAVRITTRHV